MKGRPVQPGPESLSGVSPAVCLSLSCGSASPAEGPLGAIAPVEERKALPSLFPILGWGFHSSVVSYQRPAQSAGARIVDKHL